MRKKSNVILLLVSLLFILCACGKTTKKVDSQPIELVLYSTYADADFSDAEAYIQQFMPNVTIQGKYEKAAKLEELQLAEIQGGYGPDIIMTQKYDEYVHNDILQDLTIEPALKNYMTSTIIDMEVNGRVYALPLGNCGVIIFMLNKALLSELGYEMPTTQQEFIELCKNIEADNVAGKTEARAYSMNMLYDNVTQALTLPFIMNDISTIDYSEWLDSYRNNANMDAFHTDIFNSFLSSIDVMKNLNLYRQGDFDNAEANNVEEVVEGKAVMTAVRMETFIEAYDSHLIKRGGEYVYENKSTTFPASDIAVLPFFGKTEGEHWLVTQEEWYLGINAEVSDNEKLKACKLYLEYIASNEYHDEIYGQFSNTQGSAYFKSGMIKTFTDFEEKYPDVYNCLMEKSILVDPTQFLGAEILSTSFRYYLCGQPYFYGLEQGNVSINSIEDIRETVEEFRVSGKNRYQVPDTFLANSYKDYLYKRNYTRTNESALTDILADAMRAYFSTDFAMINAGSITGNLFMGDITESDIASCMKYGTSNHLVILRCKGSDIIDVVKSNNVTGELQNGQDPHGGLVIPSGFTYTIEYKEVGEPSEKLYEIIVDNICTLDGKPIDPDK